MIFRTPDPRTKHFECVFCRLINYKNKFKGFCKQLNIEQLLFFL